MYEDTPSGLVLPSHILQLPMQGIIKVAPTAINVMDQNFSEEERYSLLTMLYRDVTQQDAMVTGNAFVTMGTKLWFTSKQSEPSFKGLVFEAYLARMCRDDPVSIGRKVFAWCTNRKPGKALDDLFATYIPFVTGDKSFVRNRATAWLYNTASCFDVQFYRINDEGLAEVANQATSNTPAGVQVKAITGNEQKEIIEPMRSNRYHRVLTVLKHASGEHSYDACLRLLTSMHKSGSITADDYHDVVSRLARPEQLGLNQQDVDQYSHYLSSLYRTGGIMDQNVSEAITLEVSNNLHTSEGGILVPADQDIILHAKQILH